MQKKSKFGKKRLQSRKRTQVSAKKFIHPTEATTSKTRASTTQSTKKHNSQGKPNKNLN